MSWGDGGCVGVFLCPLLMKNQLAPTLFYFLHTFVVTTTCERIVKNFNASAIMAAIDQYIERIADQDLKEQLRLEVERLTKKKRFGLVWENHLPDNIFLPEVTIRKGTKVALRDNTPNDVFEVQKLSDNDAICINLSSMEEKTLKLSDLIAVAQRNDVIYPYLKQMDSVQNAPDSELWHTLIEADNYHALQLLTYLYAGQVDCIYIDPPYNKPDSRDWKYNCDYVDGKDSYRHSKWLSMIAARLKIAKKLLNPKDSTLIVTIDELEYHHLGCLLEQMFPEARIQMVSITINPSGAVRTNMFARSDEYAYFVYIGDSKIYQDKGQNEAIEARWWYLRRLEYTSRREAGRPLQFYPIYINNETLKVVKIGEPLEANASRFNIPTIEGATAVFPVRDDGLEMVWGVTGDTLQRLLDDHVVQILKNDASPYMPFTIKYLSENYKEKIENGRWEIIGEREDGSKIVIETGGKLTRPNSVWRDKRFETKTHGTALLKSIIGANRFSFPKSLYAVHDTIRYVVAEKPNALILDFFAGSGTTLHAVNLLNKEDGGNRRCIMVTNNEIGETKEKQLKKDGIRPGDEEWEKWGIARYVNWPRTKCSILGKDVNGHPLTGNYITTLNETKETDRKFTQINFLPQEPSFKQKKSLVTQLNKQKNIKLPTMETDTPFLVSEDDDYNASILFDYTKIDEWLEVLDGNSHITNYFIVTDKPAVYKKIKDLVCELMGKIKESIPMELPMAEGFKTNAVFFKLGFLDKRNVERGKQLQELLPLLWMKAGAKGQCPITVKDDYTIWGKNHMALLKDEMYFRSFAEDLKRYPEIETIYIITDSRNAYLSMTEELKGYKTIQLYRDYLENFRINYAVK